MKSLFFLLLLVAAALAEVNQPIIRPAPKNQADCQPNSVFSECASSTKATCQNPSPMFVTADCRRRCVCKEGFVEKDYHCILVKDCPKTL